MKILQIHDDIMVWKLSRITYSSWPETTGNTKDIIGELRRFLCCKPEQDVEKNS